MLFQLIEAMLPTTILLENKIEVLISIVLLCGITGLESIGVVRGGGRGPGGDRAGRERQSGSLGG